jgi:hypothetical protein
MGYPVDRTVGAGTVPAGLTAAQWLRIQEQVAKLTADDGAASDMLGYSVSVDGDTAVVGASGASVGGHEDQGADYVFYRNEGGADAWGQVTKLTADDGAASDSFGGSVAISGDTAVVAARFAAVGGNPSRGAAYVYDRNLGGPDAWGQVAKLTAADGSPEKYFGVSVSISGDTALVGQPGMEFDPGAAYIFYRDQGGPDAWDQVARLTADDGADMDSFGTTTSVSGDTAVVGALGADIGGNEGQGAAYIFYRNEGGPDAWGQVAKLTAADGVAGDEFGISTSVQGDTAIVGAWKAEIAGHSCQGAAYIFDRNQGGPDTWGQVAKLTADDGAEYDLLGSSVSISGDMAVVGARWADVGGHANQGAAYVFYRNLGGTEAWGQGAKLTSDDGATEDLFGCSVSVSGDIALVGAWSADLGGHANQGAAYVFDLGAAASLHVGDIQGWLSLDPYGGYRLVVRVTVHDQDHNPVGEASVDALIWSPVGGPHARTRISKPSGMARFPWGSRDAGIWQLCVDNLAKDGFSYDPGSNDVPSCASWNN